MSGRRLCILFLAFTIMASVRAEGSTAAWQRYEGEDLAALGHWRLSDLLLLSADWRTATIDEFTLRGGPADMAGFGDEAWSFVVDGQEIELGLLGGQALDRLPFALKDVESVEIISRPGLEDGHWQEHGLIRIRTRRPSEEAGVDFRTVWGQEAGDPGPYKYTGHTAPNVEHLGPDSYLSAAKPWSAGHLALSLVDLHHVWTDANMYARISAFGDNAPVERAMLGAGLRGAWRAAGGEHRLQFDASEMRDFLYYAPLGRDFPTEVRFVRGGLTGTLPVAGLHRLRYRLHLQSQELDEEENVADFRFGLDVLRARAGVSMAGETGDLAWVFGFDQRRSRGRWSLEGGGETVWNRSALSAQLSRQQSGRELSAAAELAHLDGEVLPRLALTGKWQLRPGHELGLTAGWSRRDFRESGNPWVWIGAGYPVAPASVVWEDVTIGELGTLEFVHRLQARNGLGLRVALGARQLNGAMLADQVYQPVSGTSAYSDSATIRSGLAGSRGGFALGLDRRSGAWRFRLDCAWRLWIRGDGLLEDAWAREPERTLRGTVIWRPRPGFSLAAVAAARSATRWSDWQEPESGTVRQRVASELPAFATWDLILSQDFWKGRLGMRMILRNLFNAHTQTHPIGAERDFSAHLDLTLRLGDSATRQQR